MRIRCTEVSLVLQVNFSSIVKGLLCQCHRTYLLFQIPTNLTEVTAVVVASLYDAMGSKEEDEGLYSWFLNILSYILIYLL